MSFAFRHVLENFLAGVALLITVPFRVDDQIVVGDVEGTIMEIHLRATAIRGVDGQRVMIPNATFVTETMIVTTARRPERSD